MIEIGEAQRTGLESRVLDVVGGGFPGVSHALSFYPNIAEKFIRVQEECAKNIGSRGFWFRTDRGWKGEDILHEIPEANGIRLLEEEISKLRGKYHDSDIISSCHKALSRSDLINHTSQP